MSTIKGIKAKDAPCGTKWTNICLVCLIHPNVIRVIHSGRDKDSVITICLDLVNTHDNNPIKLLKRISLDKATNIIEAPLWEGCKRALNSLWRVKMTFLQNKDQREGEA